jgi:DNA modification methylase
MTATIQGASETKIKTADVRFVKELYPRLKPSEQVIERYRDAIANLPPIVIARGGLLVDGFHRWQAHIREGVEEIEVIDLGDIADAEIVRESIRRNASHGEQLSQADKKHLAGHLWTLFAAMRTGERITEIADLLSVDQRTTERWTKDARDIEKDAVQNRAYDLWLDCHSQRAIAKAISDEYPAFAEITQQTMTNWLNKFTTDAANLSPPESRQHFDIWSFPAADKDAGAQSYFGALPPQVIENLLWGFTKPGDIVMDPFAGSGTTVDVCKSMGRRVWASDIRGNNYSRHLPIHTHDITTGWPATAPKKADLILLDPPYWKQAAGRYSTERGELAEMSLEDFNAAWDCIAALAMAHSQRIAYIISPTQTDDGAVIDHATDMLRPFLKDRRVERRIIVPYQTQQATGQQVTWARDNRRYLKLYRDLVVLS